MLLIHHDINQDKVVTKDYVILDFDSLKYQHSGDFPIQNSKMSETFMLQHVG